jgi:hypothetical protein
MPRIAYWLSHCLISGGACVLGLIIGMVLEGIGLPITYPLLGYGLPVIILNCITSYLACRRMSIVGARWVWIP